MKPRIIAFLAVLVLTFGMSGCKLKDLFASRHAGDEAGTYPIQIHGYDSSILVRATPAKFNDYIIRDLSWLERASKGGTSPLQLELRDPGSSVDLGKVGNSIRFNLKVLGIDFPSTIVAMKCRPEKELWLMLDTWTGWILFRFNLVPVAEGTMVDLNVLAPSPDIPEYLLSPERLARLALARIDLMMAYIQSEFDPSLDPVRMTEKGLRGEMYSAFLQGYQTSTRVDAEAPEVTRWIFDRPENIEELTPGLRLEPDCFDREGALFGDSDDLVCCRARYWIGALDVEAILLSRGGWEDQDYTRKIWIVATDSLMEVDMEVSPRAGGSEVGLVMASELPDQDSAHGVDVLMAIADIPAMARRILEKIKAGVEADGS